MKKKLLAILLNTICNFCLSQVPPYVPANGLVAWYPFTGDAADSSGNLGNNGTVHGATLTADRSGNLNSAYHFDGIANYIGGSCSNFPAAERTISLWFNATNTGVTKGNGVFGYGGSTCGQSWIQSIYSSLFGLGMHCNINDAIYSTLVQYNAWHHWLITNDNINKTRFYIDGQLVFDTTHFFATYVAGKDFIIGGISSPSGTGGLYTDVNIDPFAGKIDDVGIWNRALTPCEITQLFTGQILSVTQNPANYTAGIGDTALFTVVSPNANASFQWQTALPGSEFHDINDGALYTGTTNDTLLVNNVTPENNNQPFRCVVSLPFYCHDTTAAASLTVTTVTPVTLLSFNVVRHAKKVLLKWVAENESGLLSYSIERSSDGFIFHPIGIVPAIKNGVRHSYDFTDEVPFAGFNYYRLKSLDADGKYAYSEIKKVAAQKNVWNIYPNPSNGKFTIGFERSSEVAEKTILVRNVLGQVIYRVKTSAENLEINLHYKVKPGIYSLEIFDNNNLVNEKQKLVIK